MKWFEGSVADAVAASKSKNSLFCVVILGADEISQQLEVSLGSVDVQTIFTDEDIVTIRVTSESEEFKQFSRIYTSAKSPSIYCITPLGAPVEIISEATDLTTTANLKLKVLSAINCHKEVITATLKAKSGTTAPQQSNSTPELAGTSANPGPSSSSPASDTVVQVPLESRIERAKRLAAAKQQKKAEEEADDEKKREIERRQVGQKVAEMKRWQEEQEIKKAAEERRKDKEQEVKLRQRLRDQIAQDRIDRQARADMASGITNRSDNEKPTTSTSSTTTSTTSRTQPNYTGQARLQFRLPDGSSQNHSFDPESNLGDVRRYLEEQVVPYREFSIWVAFPRREFVKADYNVSLRELGLLPSSALLIIPVGGVSIAQNAGQAGQGVFKFLTTFFGYVLYPITFILTLLQRALPVPQSGSGTQSTPGQTQRDRPRSRHPLDNSSPNTPTSSSAAKKSDPSPSTSSESRSRSSQSKKAAEKTTDGNVHRLRDVSDSDDEKATWNGNSTQQM